jgi:DNA-binding response OmpR family regulator
MRVLVIDDKTAFLGLLCSHLRKHGFVVDAVESLDEAAAATAANIYEMVLLDLLLPDGNGATFVQELRAKSRKVPVIVISGQSELAERIKLFEAGADDYLVKPFDFDELVARMRAIARRQSPSDAGHDAGLSFANMVLYPHRQFALINGSHVVLRRPEAALLEKLLGRAGQPIERALLMSCVYTDPGEIESNSLTVHVHHLRQKLAQAGAAVEIASIRGFGYALQSRDPDLKPA